MLRDPIVDEIRTIRHQTEAKCGNDWKRLVNHYRAVKVDESRLVRLPKADSKTPTSKHVENR